MSAGHSAGQDRRYGSVGTSPAFRERERLQAIAWHRQTAWNVLRNHHCLIVGHSPAARLPRERPADEDADWLIAWMDAGPVELRRYRREGMVDVGRRAFQESGRYRAPTLSLGAWRWAMERELRRQGRTEEGQSWRAERYRSRLRRPARHSGAAATRRPRWMCDREQRLHSWSLASPCSWRSA